MNNYYAPAAHLIPEDIESPTWIEGYGIIPRKWGVSLFDWAELQNEHKLHIPYTSAHDRLAGCNLEFAVTADSIEVARERMRPLHAMMYVGGVHPFSVQFMSTHSINEYAGINGRSRGGQQTLHEGLREGITSGTTSVEVWPAPYASDTVTRRPDLQREITVDLFAQIAESTAKWNELKNAFPICRFLERVLTSSPAVPDTSQSLLHVWTGIESIFPKVQSEVSFRLALYLAQLQSPLSDRQAFFQRAKKSYTDRSKVAHGGELKSRNGADPWAEAWFILRHAVRAILTRNEVPSEEALISELLAAADADTREHPPEVVGTSEPT